MKKLLDEYKRFFDDYVPTMGQGITMAAQTVTALYRLIVDYSIGGLFCDMAADPAGDNCDLANWLYTYGDDATQYILDGIRECTTEAEYEDILERLAKHILNSDDLEALDRVSCRGDVFDCEGRFRWVSFD